MAQGNDSPETEALTRAGEVCGSPVYLSPEQCLYLDLDNRTDIYSLGVCLYECLTGIPPLKASNVYDTLKMHVYEMPLKFSVVAPNVEISQRLEEIVFRCLAKSPNDRYETMMQLKHDLMRARKSEFDLSQLTFYRRNRCFRLLETHYFRNPAAEQALDPRNLFIAYADARVASCRCWAAVTSSGAGAVNNATSSGANYHAWCGAPQF